MPPCAVAGASPYSSPRVTRAASSRRRRTQRQAFPLVIPRIDNHDRGTQHQAFPEVITINNHAEETESDSEPEMLVVRGLRRRGPVTRSRATRQTHSTATRSRETEALSLFRNARMQTDPGRSISPFVSPTLRRASRRSSRPAPRGSDEHESSTNSRTEHLTSRVQDAVSRFPRVIPRQASRPSRQASRAASDEDAAESSFHGGLSSRRNARMQADDSSFSAFASARRPGRSPLRDRTNRGATLASTSELTLRVRLERRRARMNRDSWRLSVPDRVADNLRTTGASGWLGRSSPSPVVNRAPPRVSSPPSWPSSQSSLPDAENFVEARKDSERDGRCLTTPTRLDTRTHGEVTGCTPTGHLEYVSIILPVLFLFYPPPPPPLSLSISQISFRSLS